MTGTRTGRVTLTGRGTLTRRGAGLLTGTAATYGAGEWLGYPVLRALAAMVAVAVLTAVLLAARPLRLTVARDIARTRVHRGQDVDVRLTITNRARRRQPPLAAVDGVPLLVPAIPDGESVTLDYRVPAPRRGRVEIGPLRVDRTDPLGVTGRRRSAGRADTVWVYPVVHPVGPLAGTARRHSDRASVGAAPLRGSTHLRALREYVPGDEPRHIHWKATAASGALMVRDLRDHAEPSLEVLLDNRSGVLGPAAFEEAVDLAASLLVAAAQSGARTRLRTATGLDLQPRTGPQQTGALLDALCTVRQGPGRLPRTADPREGTLVLVTGLTADADVGWFAGPGTRILVDLSAQRLPTRPARMRVRSGTSAAALAAAWAEPVP